MLFPSSKTVRHNVADGIIRRQASCGKDCQMVEFTLSRGAIIPMHSHPNEQIGIVVKGSLVLKMSGERTIIMAGDGYSIPSGEEHGVEVLEDSLVLDVFAPPREDYKDAK